MKKLKVIFFILLLSSQFMALQKPDPAYDNLIVPGERIGPVLLGAYVSEIVKVLGKPDKIFHTHFNNPNLSEEQYYTYNKKGKLFVWFAWLDEGLQPVVEKGWRGINTESNYWSTDKGIHVGSTIPEVVAAYGQPYKFYHSKTMDVWQMNYAGITFFVKDRNSPVYRISILPHELINESN